MSCLRLLPSGGWAVQLSKRKVCPSKPRLYLGLHTQKAPSHSHEPRTLAPTSISGANRQLENSLDANRFTRLAPIARQFTFPPTIGTYNAILRSYAKLELYDDALALWSDMTAMGITPNTESCNAILRMALRREGGFQHFLNLLETYGLQMNALSYQLIITHHANNNNLAMCLQLLSDMHTDGVVSNIVTAQILIDITSDRGLPRLALDIAHNFEANSSRRLEGRSWLHILISSSDALFADGVLACWDKVIKDHFIEPDEGLCIQVLHTAARHGLPELAQDALRMLKVNGVTYREHHVAPLLEAFIVKDQLKEAFSAIGLMRENGIEFTSQTMHPIYRRVSRSIDDVDAAYTILEDIHKEGGKVDIASFNIILHAAVSLRDIQRAIGTYKEAAAFGVTPDVETLNALLSGCIVLSHKQLGDRLTEEFRDAGVIPDLGTYERLIILCLTQPTYEDAFFFLEQMKEEGFKPTYKVYDALIRKMISVRDGRWKLAHTEMTQQAGFSVSSTSSLRRFIDSLGAEE